MCDKGSYNYLFTATKSYDQRCCMFSKDRKFEVVWDVNEIIRNIDTSNFPIEQKNVLNLSEQDGGICTNPDYAMETDIEKPCIIIKLNRDIEVFIDGNHRLYKARKMNVENIPCYVLPEEFHKKFIIDFDPYVYEKVVADHSAL